MTDTRAASLRDLVAELEQRDGDLAALIDLVGGLADRASAVRARAASVGAALEAIPLEVEATEQALQQARQAERDAQIELDAARARLESVERARRPKEAELALARSGLRGAEESISDARHRIERLETRRRELRESGAALRAESDRLVADARDVAAALRDAPRVADAGKGDPGATLEEIEDWGGRARAALFVARGTLDNERERVIAEANAVAEAVLGEQPGGTSVALVRRRLEQALG